jgi:hypothetical protein
MEKAIKEIEGAYKLKYTKEDLDNFEKSIEIKPKSSKKY